MRPPPPWLTVLDYISRALTVLSSTATATVRLLPDVSFLFSHRHMYSGTHIFTRTPVLRQCYNFYSIASPYVTACVVCMIFFTLQ
jgi:hypothetical protein